MSEVWQGKSMHASLVGCAKAIMVRCATRYGQNDDGKQMCIELTAHGIPRRTIGMRQLHVMIQNTAFAACKLFHNKHNGAPHPDLTLPPLRWLL
jgi:hypothetical protein